MTDKPVCVYLFAVHDYEEGSCGRYIEDTNVRAVYATRAAAEATQAQHDRDVLRMPSLELGDYEAFMEAFGDGPETFGTYDPQRRCWQVNKAAWGAVVGDDGVFRNTYEALLAWYGSKLGRDAKGWFVPTDATDAQLDVLRALMPMGFSIVKEVPFYGPLPAVSLPAKRGPRPRRYLEAPCPPSNPAAPVKAAASGSRKKRAAPPPKRCGRTMAATSAQAAATSRKS